VEKRFERVRHDQYGRTKHDQKERRENKQDQREEQLDRQLCRLLFDLLDTLRPEGVGVDAEGFADAGTKLFGLHEHRDQIANHIDIGAVSEVFPGIRTGAACTLLESHNTEFVTQRRLRFFQFLCGSCRGLIKAQARLYADDEQVEDVRKAFANLSLAVGDFSTEPEIRS